MPAAFGDTDASVVVGGITAENIDYSDLINRGCRWSSRSSSGLSFILLTVVFRSVVLSVTAVILNLLSVGAAYGLLVLVFQDGIGASLLGFQQVDRIEAWVPLFLFSVLFALSMDYHVFLLSRIRERYAPLATPTTPWFMASLQPGASSPEPRSSSSWSSRGSLRGSW